MAKNNRNNAGGIPVHRVSSRSEFSRVNNELRQRGFVALDALKPGLVKSISLMQGDAAQAGAQDMATTMRGGAWCKGPISTVAWDFDDRSNATVQAVNDKDGKPLGLGYVRWGAGDNIPSTIPPLAMALPYTAAPLRYIADLTAGLGPRLMYRFPDGTLCEYRDAGERLLAQLEEVKSEKLKVKNEELDDGMGFEKLLEPSSQSSQDPAVKRAQEAYDKWEKTWYGEDVTEEDGTKTHIPGAKEFLENNNLDLHLSQCMQDNVMLDIYFPTVGLQRGRRGAWDPRVVKVSVLPCHSTRLGVMNEHRHINNVFFSDSLRTKGMGATVVNPESAGFTMYPAAMPESMLSDLRYIVESNQRTRIKDRPTWVVCPTFYPSLNKPYYPQPAWWSVFTSKAFDFSSTILYDKAKQRENRTSWGRVIFISLDWLNDVFSDEGLAGNKEAQEKYIEELDQSIENFLQHRENQGKMMRQWMWLGQDGKDHHNVEIVDVADATKDEASAGKDELELSTSPIFLALQVDPRLVGVPMVHSSNGGTALREMHLLKQQQLSVHQRLYLNWLQAVTVTFNKWDEHATWVIAQQTLTTLDNSKTGLVDTIASEGA